METILFLAHTEADGTLARAALETLTAARTAAAGLGDAELMVGLFGGKTQEGAAQTQGAGAKRILGVTGADFSQPRYASDAAAAEALCREAKASIVICPATSRMARVMSGVALRLGGKVDTHITGLKAEGGVLSVNRWYYRQRMEAVLQRTQRPWVLLLEGGCHEAWKGTGGTASVEAVALALPENCKRTVVEGLKAPANDQQTIRPDAGILLVAGAGWTKAQADGKAHVEDAEKIILDFLECAQASLGGSKSVVDLGGEGQAVLRFMTHLNQIGQTGSTPRHAKGLSTCCHGEEPHVVGWRFINERRAIDLDTNCGWAHGKADVLYVADAFEVMKKVNALLGAKA
ncbi:MAG: electron transfer flavoprotein subunit alpha [Verrucomicrobiae bacterium]|nr:electron transfer flavoprotein subunit alpha [Verrucomicrobiae bacterium]